MRALFARVLLSFPLAVAPALQAEDVRLLVPIVVDVDTGSARFSSDLALTNRAPTTVPVRLRYTPSLGRREGSGVVTETLRPGEQRLIPDALAFLRERGLAIPSAASGQQGGTLLVTFEGVSSASDVAVTARTGAPTRPPLRAGRAGLAYGAVAPGSDVGTARLFGLRANGRERANVAVYSTGETPVTVRLTAVSGAGDARRAVLAEVALSAWEWRQLPFGASGFESGWVEVERVAGSGTFGAYGVVNDNLTHDGCFVSPVAAGLAAGTLHVPVVVESDGFASELVLANAGEHATTLTLEYVESLSPSSGGGGTVSVALAAGEQRVIPDAIGFLRTSGAALGARGAASYAGALRVSGAEGTLAGIFAGARTWARALPDGAFSVFTPAATPGEAATLEAFLFGLRADEANRSNVALVNLGRRSTLVLEVQAFDGDFGGVPRGAAETVALPPLGWLQLSDVLRPLGIRNGWVRVARLEGTGRWLAYAVVNDGAEPGQATGDGAFVPMVRGATSPEDVVRATDWVIPAGETRRVERDLVVVAERDIEILGTLVVPENVNVSLMAARALTLRGAVTPEVAPPGARRALRHDTLASPENRRGPCLPPAGGAEVLFESGRTTISGPLDLAPGTDLFLGATLNILTDFRPSLVVSAPLRTANGRDASRRGECGQSSGRIEIGTPEAGARAQELRGRLEDAVTASVPFRMVTLEAPVRSGDGGRGFTDRAGVRSTAARAVTYVASRGGDSGAVSGAVLGPCPSPLFSTGNAGDAGDAGSLVRAPDGVLPGERGWNVTVEMDGSMTDGRAVFFCDEGLLPGASGRPGRAVSANVAAGNGGPGGPGGDARLVTYGRVATVFLIDGANGGAATDRSRNGGDGGAFAYEAARLSSVERFVVENYANGGAGWDGCQATPRALGTSGGRGGSSATDGPGPFQAEVGASVSGGKGGDGVVAGAPGGKAGSFLGRPGVPGAAGAECPALPTFTTGGMYGVPGTTFDLRYSDPTGTIVSAFTQTVAPAAPLPGGGATVTPLQNRNLDGTLQSIVFIRNGTEGLADYGTDFYNASPNVQFFFRLLPPELLPNGLGAGESVSRTGTRAFTQQGQTTSAAYTLRTTFVGVESVTVPAGTYPNAQRLLLEYTEANGSTNAATRWLVPGLGQVKYQDSSGTTVLVRARPPG